MPQLKFRNEKPGLLVSVRSAAEALTALAGGADVVDIKEPNRGSLGPADAETISAVVSAVNGRAPVTAALGELVDLLDVQDHDNLPRIPDGVSLFKIGLARCALRRDWRSLWHSAVDSIVPSSCNVNAPQPVAVAYADWPAAQSPPPNGVLSMAIERRCPALLIDTWDKATGSLFDHWRLENVQNFIAAARSGGLAVVLAGSLAGEGIAAAARLAPDLIAVRSAACDVGRTGTVTVDRVRRLKQEIAAASGVVAEFVRIQPGI